MILSYASEAEARAYVARVLGRARRPGPTRVYVIAAPQVTSKRGALAKLRPVLAALLPGAELVTYGDVFAGQLAEGGPRPLAADRVPVIAAAATGAVVLPCARRSGSSPTRYLLGEVAAAEAAALADLGVPVLVLTGAGMCAWPDVRLVPAPVHGPSRLRWLAELPETPPPGAPQIPTVAASYRALGVPVPVKASDHNPKTRRKAS